MNKLVERTAESRYHIPVEIKSASTLSSALFAGLHRFSKVVDFTINPMLVYAGGEERIQNGVQVLNHWSIESALRKL